MYPDRKIVVYLGYPSEVAAKPPRWIETLVRSEVENENSPYHFYLSGGSVTKGLLQILRGRAASALTAQKMSMKLVQGYTSRLLDLLMSPDIEKILQLVQESARSTEYRILLDLWVLSRSDVYVVDCDLLGRGRSGMETVYAHDSLRTVGVSDSPILDLWYQYHLDSIVKSQMCFSHLETLRHAILAARGTSSPSPAQEKPEEAPVTPQE